MNTRPLAEIQNPAGVVIMAVCVSIAVTARPQPGQNVRWARRMPAVVAVALVLLGLISLAARLDAASDGTVLRPGWSSWRAAGLVVDVPNPAEASGLRDGDVITAIAGHRLSDGLGGVARPNLGDAVRTTSFEMATPAR